MTREMSAELAPVWRQLDGRITARMFVGVLACLAVHPIRTRLAARGIQACWTSIRESMPPWVRTTTRLRQIDGTLIVNWQDARPAAAVA